MLNPTPELPDFTPIERVRFPTRIRNALNGAGMKSIGDVREASDATLLSLPDLGPGSVAFLREKLGRPSTEGVRLDPRVAGATVTIICRTAGTLKSTTILPSR